MIEEQLQDKDKATEMLAALISRLDGLTDSDRYYDSVCLAKKRLTDYVDGTLSVFNHRHDTPRQEHTAENPPKSEPALQETTPTLESKAPEPLTIGTCLTIDRRQFAVDSVDDSTQKVSLQDVIFEDGTGFPIFRKESIEHVRSHMEQSDMAQEAAAPQTDEPPAALTPPKKKKRNALAYAQPCFSIGCRGPPSQ